MLLSLVLIFVTIYQHNQIIKLNYEKQRLAKKRIILKKEKNELMSQLAQRTNYSHISALAETKLNMVPLKLSQIITLTTQAQINFFMEQQ
jgi:hypothetical protein